MVSLSINISRAPQTASQAGRISRHLAFYHRMDPYTNMPIRLGRVGGWGNLNKSHILITLSLSAVLQFLKCLCLRNLSQASCSLVESGSLKYDANCFCGLAWSSLPPSFLYTQTLHQKAAIALWRIFKQSKLKTTVD